MKRRYLSLVITLVLGCVVGAFLLLGPGGAPAARADGAYHNLAAPFSQNWPTAALISAHNDWSGVPSILGYDGSVAGAVVGVDPQTLVGEATLGVSGVVSANVTSLSIDSAASAGVFELEPATDGVTEPTVALHSSSNYDAPSIVIHLNSAGRTNITVQYDIMDLDAGNYNAIQPVALQFRAGTTGAFTNVAAGFNADVTDGPNVKGRVTHINAVLPAAADNQPQLQVRILTANANGTDEFIGIDNISITSTGSGTVAPPTATTPPSTPDPSLDHKTYLPIVTR